ncbi:hypothetical protein OY671_009986, partial [Metschnikowia pulcherrima]
ADRADERMGRMGRAGGNPLRPGGRGPAGASVRHTRPRGPGRRRGTAGPASVPVPARCPHRRPGAGRPPPPRRRPGGFPAPGATAAPDVGFEQGRVPARAARGRSGRAAFARAVGNAQAGRIGPSGVRGRGARDAGRWRARRARGAVDRLSRTRARRHPARPAAPGGK